jgi:RHS repeat-associated protein
VIGDVEPNPATCPPASPPPPAITTLAWVAESSNNEVQAIDEPTGALVGTPITVGTTPKGIGYWRPVTSSHMDPEVVVSNNANHSVTLIDTVTSAVLATVSIPSGSGATAVATSPTNRFALVVDASSGNVSVINLQTNVDQGEISLTTTANVLGSIAFSPSGQYAYVTDPSEHKIFVIQHTAGTSPYYAYDTTYTNSSYDFSGIASDLSSTSSGSFFVTDAQASGYLLEFTVAGTLTAPTQVTRFNSPSQQPGPVSINPGATDAWVGMTGTQKVDDVTVSSGTIHSYTASSAFTAVGPIGLSADGGTLLAADTGSATVQGLASSSGAATTSTTTDAVVSAIAPALAQAGSWDAYVTAGSNVDVVNTNTLSVTQTIADANGPVASAASADGKYLYVANSTTPSVSVIATADVGTATNPVVKVITIPKGLETNPPIPGAIAMNPQEMTLLVTDTANGAVDVIDMNPADTTQYETVVAQIGLGGSGISSTLTPSTVTVSPDGKFAYVTEASGTSSHDGVVVLQLASTTTTGYTFLADNEALTQGSDTMVGPGDIAINPNDETAYVYGTYGVSGTPAVFNLPIGTNGQLSNGTGTPVGTGTVPAGMTFSPEDDSVFASANTSNDFVSISEATGTTNYTSVSTLYPEGIAVTPDGLYLGVNTASIAGCGANSVEIYNAGSGAPYGSVSLTAFPTSITFGPQATPQAVTTSELVGGASNPAESAIASGMNDVVTSGTPSDAPGATAGVDTATGAYSFSLDSMTIPDLGIPLDMTATYDSSRGATNDLLGWGWDYTYGITATQNAHNAATNPCAIIVTQETGATVTFFPSAQGPYSTCPASGYEAPGWAQATMTFQSSCNGTDACFVMTRGAMTKYFIDETTGQLVKVQDLNGNAITITWGSHTACSGATSTEPCQVTGADGVRTLTFSYPSPGSGTCPSWTTSCVVVTDPLGRNLTYTKDSNGRLTHAELSNSTTSAWYVFEYTTGSLLTNWWDPQNNASHPLNNSYGTDVTYTSGQVTQVTGPAVASVTPLSTTAVTPTTTFSYTSYNAATGNGAVLVQNPDFKQSVYEPGASQTLDTYAEFELVSSVVGYGPLKAYYNGSTAPVVATNPSESAVPMRDGWNLMPSESMNALAGSTEAPIGTQNSQYDSGVTITTYDAHGNALSSTDPSGNSTSRTYNGLNEVLSSKDGLGNLMTNTYSATGLLLTTTPPANGTGGIAKTSNWYNSNGTLCASRDAIETNVYGALSSCVTAGSNATTYSYSSSGDLTLTTVTDSSTLTSTTQNEFDANGNMCATLSPDGYAITGDRLTGCPSSGAPYAAITLSRDLYANATKVISSLAVAGTNTYATTYACTDLNGNTTAAVGPRGSFTSCAALNPTTSIDTTFSTYDAEGDKVQSTEPLTTSGTQGPTTIAQFDASSTDVLDLSALGYITWVANNSANLAPFETGTLIDDQANAVTTAPETDLSGSCVDNAGNPCPDMTVTTFDYQGQQTSQASAGNGDGGGSTPTTTGQVNNPDGSVGGDQSNVGGGTVVQETSQQTYNANAASTNTVTEHWNGSAWVTDSSTSTAYAPNGSQCWTSPTTVSLPSCGSPPTSVATVDYYDLKGNLVALVGPGGSGTVEPGGSCDPTAALGTYSINTAHLCAFTTYNVYNEANQLIETIQPSLSSSTSGYVTAGATTTYGYDASGNRTSLVNPAGNTVTSAYDGAKRLVAVTYSDVSTTNCTVAGTSYDTCYGYNVDGTRSQMVDSTGTTTYAYDNAGRVTSVTDSNGSTVTYAYTAFGQENCISYPGFTHTCASSGAGTNSPPSGDVTYDYDAQGRLSSVVDWNGDAFTYAYDCTGDVAWLAETPSSQIPTVSQCQGSSGTIQASPAPSASGTTYVVSNYTYSSGGSGNLLNSQATAAVTHSGSTSLLEFNTLTYDDNNNLTSSTPKVSGTIQTADTYGYDAQQRLTSGPETSGSVTAYSYTNSNTDTYPTCSQPYCSHGAVDQMGIDAMPKPGSAAQLGSEYAGNGELCWVAVITTTSSGTCGAPGGTSSSYETASYNTSGDLTATASIGGYGSSSALTWNVDTNEPTCINPSGTTCTGPSSTQPSAQTYTYDGERLRTTSQSWSGSSVATTDFTWDTTTSALLSNGSFDYIYGTNSNVPIAQVDKGDSVTGELVTDPSSNVKGIVEVSSSAAHPDVLANYADYDAYGNPMTKSGGSVEVGGLTVDGMTGDGDSAGAFGFGGGYLDGTGLDYLVNRFYNAAIGLYMSVDPAIASTETPYAYATDNPITQSDPLGEKPIKSADNICWATWVYPFKVSGRNPNNHWQLAAAGGVKCNNTKDLGGILAYVEVDYNGNLVNAAQMDVFADNYTQKIDGQYYWLSVVYFYARRSQTGHRETWTVSGSAFNFNVRVWSSYAVSGSGDRRMLWIFTGLRA